MMEVEENKMKRIVSLLLIVCMLVLLCACKRATEPTEEITTQESTETEKWEPYEGDKKNYVYYYDKGVSRMWEEDLLFLTNTYLEEHPLLTPEESHISYREGTAWKGYYSDEKYDPEKRAAFLAIFNEAIPQLQNMNKTQFLNVVRKMLASTGDAHAYIISPERRNYPLTVIEDNGAFYVINILKEHESFMFAQLLSINGIAIHDVIDALRPYISYENDYCLIDQLTRPYYAEALFSLEFLQEIDIVKDGDTAEFELKKEDGSIHKLELTAVDLDSENYAKRVDAYRYDSPLFRISSSNYWYIYLDDTPYLRISDFEYNSEENADETLLDVGNALFAEVRDAGGAEKLIIDLRNNGGGYQLQGYHQIVSILQRMEIKRIYVLINGGVFSQSVVFATYLKQELDNVVLVGSPAGQAPNFFGAVERYTMPNTRTEFALAWQWWIGWEDYPYDALMPDVAVAQTLQDYKDRKDAALIYVLQDEIP